MPIRRIGEWSADKGTPLQQVRGLMQEVQKELTDLVMGGCTDAPTAKRRTAELTGDLAELIQMQAKMTDFSSTLATMNAGEGGGQARSDVRLRAFKGPQAHERAYAAGQWCRWRLLKDERAAGWCQEHMDLLGAASESINTAGGFLVPDTLSKVIIDLREEFGVARRECDVVTMDSDTRQIPRRDGGLTAYYTGEGVEIPDSEVAWGLVSLTCKKLAAMTRISSELSDDAVINLGEHIVSEIATAFASAEDAALFLGDGTSAHGGMYGLLPKIVDGTHNAGMVAALTAAHDTFAEIDGSDLLAAMTALPERFEKNAKWFCSGLAWGTVFCRLLMNASGNSMINLSDGIKRAFMGHEVVTSSKLPHGPATDYTGLPMILFGDMRKAVTFGSRREMRIKVDGSRFMTQDQIAILGTERYDINVHELGDNTNAGAIVALVGGSG